MNGLVIHIAKEPFPVAETNAESLIFFSWVK